MILRSPTTWLPRLALALLMLLVSHDVIMTMDPHAVEAHGAHAHGAPRPEAHAHEHGSNASIAECMSLEAARTSETAPTDGEQGATVLTECRWLAAESEAVAANRDEPGTSPSQRRAMLQVYLN